MASTEPEHEHREDEEAPAGEDEDTGAQVAPIVKLEKSLGAGTVKLLKHKETGKVRLVMRQSKTLKICANHLVLPTMTVQEHAGNDKSCLWHAADFADGELKDELFCIRFASVENCKTFMEMFQEVAESQKPKEENKDASAAAESLEKLSVEEKKAEDKAGEAVATKEGKETEDDYTEKADIEKKDGEATSST
ncbi:Ran-binding protein 1-like protein b [Hibiscus syriacus]|uniref:Ran-binding protein 1-like protein b n=1 Tax=Hibiscus syriacus TaxID=106335 RepID=A0A6A3B2H1_HIBSY|nr:Ran-binding protein 1-like protein b [Hibiscus syriacus]